MIQNILLGMIFVYKKDFFSNYSWNPFSVLWLVQNKYNLERQT